MSARDFPRGRVIKINSAMIQRLKAEAAASPLKRSRLCLHKNTDALVQEMVIALRGDSYIKPHKHLDREESLHVIAGSLCLVTFDPKGKVMEKILVSNERGTGNFLCKVNKNVWHTMIPLSKFVVYHEVIKGPYVRDRGAAITPWIPNEKDKAGIRDFFSRLRRSE